MTSTRVIASDLSDLLVKFQHHASLGLTYVSSMRVSFQVFLEGFSIVKGIGLRLVGPNLVGGILISLSACQPMPSAPARKIVLQQSWELNSGDFVAGHLVTGGLGDITVELNNNKLRAPFAGKVELASEGARCIYFSTPEIPAYLFRYCGVKKPYIGTVSPEQVIGQGYQIHFATLRRQPDGTWALVEPSNQVLEKTLRSPSRSFFF